MNSRTVVISGALALLCLGLGLWVGTRWSASSAAPSASAEAMAGADAPPARKPLYWHDPMVPGPRFDKPGPSPFMDMQLVPVYADAGSGSGVNVSPAFAQSLGIRTATVRRAPLGNALDLVGTVAENERSVVTVQTRAAGYVERLHVRAVLDPVRRGQPLATLFVPEWNAALEEYLGLRAAQAPASLVDAARSRLRLLSIPADAIAQSEASGTAQSRFTLSAPASGVVTELNAREGMLAAPGATLFRIADLGTAWVHADVPEGQAGAVAIGARAEVRVAAYPEKTFRATVSALLPQVDTATRTLRARLEIANPGQLLKPGMFVRVSLGSAGGDAALVVPQEAVIATGKRTVVVLASADGSYAPVEVTLGRAAGDDVEVKSGLTEGQQVVASGQFLLDSEASLKAGLARLAMPADAAASAMPMAPSASMKPSAPTPALAPASGVAK